jgi:hypothetical protein
MAQESLPLQQAPPAEHLPSRQQADEHLSPLQQSALSQHEAWCARREKILFRAGEDAAAVTVVELVPV